ncbi:hypothetical protein FK220_009645 [Flavobacteriaceae bacterium TP-CH-4]|uniref:Uncharacterized protein n=1 Tax=Pelagihabitans pacificus TaxID=2696054 RepID=A0A967AST5_9FLAO|nr:hypothetical protein [Pelagihabitans pacificus]NHF59603.1 hypothetical protein [Pelagihabitans pacificus]
MTDKTLLQISYAIVFLAASSCIISIYDNSIYQDGEWANAQLLGQDIVTLSIIVPLLFVSSRQAFLEQRWKWRMVLGGILFYFVYTYAFFMFVTSLTFLYFFHLPIFGLSIMGFFGIVAKLFQEDFGLVCYHKFAKGAAIGFLLLISLMLGFLWLSDIISHLTVEGHRSDTPDGEPLLIVYSLDLSLVVPLMLLAVFGLWRRRRYGYLLAGIMLTKAATIGFALMGMSLALYIKKLSLDVFLMICWFILGIMGTLTALLYLRKLRRI